MADDAIDIVDRLLDWTDYEPMKMFCEEAIPDIHEAVREIKQLRTEVDQLWNLYTTYA